MNHYDNLQKIQSLCVSGDHAGLSKPEHDEMLVSIGENGENMNLVFHRKLGAQHRFGVRLVTLRAHTVKHPDGTRSIGWTVASNTFLPMPAPTRSKNGSSTDYLTVPTPTTGIHFQTQQHPTR